MNLELGPPKAPVGGREWAVKASRGDAATVGTTREAWGDWDGFRGVPTAVPTFESFPAAWQAQANRGNRSFGQDPRGQTLLGQYRHGEDTMMLCSPLHSPVPTAILA